MRVIDLFCGCGGFSLGFMHAGCDVVAAFDHDLATAHVYKKLVGIDAMVADVGSLTAADLPDCDAIIGGPPCQPFSIAGKRKGMSDERDGIPCFFRLVLEVRPLVFLIENVPPVQNSAGFASYIELLQEAEYAIDFRILNAADYGLPQARRRLFIVGLLDSKCVPSSIWPLPTHSRYPSFFTEHQWKSAGEVLLPMLKARYSLDKLPRWIRSRWEHVPRERRDGVMIHNQLSPGVGGPSLNIRPLSLPSYTITSNFCGYHVVNDGNYWRLLKEEGAILQGLPYLSEMSAKQIGDAVPPSLAEMLAKSIMEVI